MSIENYEGGYFDHFLAMYSLNFENQLSEENLKDMITLYLHHEVDYEFENLIEEIKRIQKEEAWDFFAKLITNGFKNPEEIKLLGEFLLESNP